MSLWDAPATLFFSLDGKKPKFILNCAYDLYRDSTEEDVWVSLLESLIDPENEELNASNSEPMRFKDNCHHLSSGFYTPYSPERYGKHVLKSQVFLHPTKQLLCVHHYHFEVFSSLEAFQKGVYFDVNVNRP